MTRTRALQKKQRSGNIAPPTPGQQSPISSRLSGVEASSASLQHEEPERAEEPLPGISNRVKGFFFSYLPTLSKSIQPQKQKRLLSNQPGLPFPPPEVLEKARRPISTPIRPPLPKAIPLKEQVHLQHAPSPKKSVPPPPSKPQRLVALQPIPLPVPIVPMPIQRNRRSSGGSVKDLVRSFEKLESEVPKKPEIKRVRSIRNCNEPKGDRPTWKP
jgi:hypothetical protein